MEIDLSDFVTDNNQGKIFLDKIKNGSIDDVIIHTKENSYMNFWKFNTPIFTAFSYNKFDCFEMLMNLMEDGNIWKEWKFLKQKESYSEIEVGADGKEHIKNESIDLENTVIDENQNICKNIDVSFDNYHPVFSDLFYVVALSIYLNNEEIFDNCLYYLQKFNYYEDGEINLIDMCRQYNRENMFKKLQKQAD